MVLVNDFHPIVYLCINLLHLVLYEDGLECDLLAWPGHPEEPGDPLQE